MNTIPNLLQSRQGDHPITTIGTGGSHAAIAGQVTARVGIDVTGDPTGYQHVEEAAEDSADTVDIDDGQGPDKLKETLIIQRAACRYFLNRIEGSSNDKLNINYHFEACKASANAVPAGYRMIYLGPVPHLLLCLEWIISCAQGSKDKIKARRAEATPQMLLDLSSRQTQMR